MFGSAVKGVNYRDTKGAVATWTNTVLFSRHKAEKRNSLVVSRLPDMSATPPHPVFTCCVIRKQSVFLPVQGQALWWYCQFVETLLTYIPGSCPTLVVAITLSVCLTCHAYKSNRDDYLLLSDVIKCWVSFYDFVNDFMTMIHQALFNWSRLLVSVSRYTESV